MRAILILLLLLVVGCAAEEPPPPEITAEQRHAIRMGLAKLGARQTAEDDQTIWVSLRQTHVEVGPVGGVIESTPRNTRDVRDFVAVSESVVSHFLDTEEQQALAEWLTRISRRTPNSIERQEYERLSVSVSRRPLRILFTQKEPVDQNEDAS